MSNRTHSRSVDDISARSIVVFVLEALAFAIVGGVALVVTTQYLISSVGTPNLVGLVILIIVPGLALAGTHRAINYARGG